jgi:hypothetical protein
MYMQIVNLVLTVLLAAGVIIHTSSKLTQVSNAMLVRD